jgi:hypothetical protein
LVVWSLRPFVFFDQEKVLMKKRLIAMLGMAVLGLALAAGCSQAEPEGAMEEAGAAVDNAADQMEEAADDAGDALEDAADAVGDAAEQAGDAVEKATDAN